MSPQLTQSSLAIVICKMSSEALGIKRGERTPDVLDPDANDAGGSHKISRSAVGEREETLWRLAVVSGEMSSEPAVGDKRSGPDATDISDGVGGHGRSQEAGAAGQQCELAEMRSKKLKKDGEARNLSREESKMMAFMWGQLEDAQGGQGVKADYLSTQLEGRGGHGKEKVGQKRIFRDACDTGEAGRQQRGRVVREVWQEAGSSKTRE